MGPLLIRSLGRIDFYFTTGLPLMPLYYIIEKDTNKTIWKMTGTTLGPKRIAFYLRNCVLTRLDFSKNSFRIKGGNVGRGRALRGSVHEEGREAKSW